MWPIVTHTVVSVGLSVTIVRPTKMAELFELWTQVGLRNHVLDGVQIPMGRAMLRGAGAAHHKVQRLLSACSGNTAFLSNYSDHLLLIQTDAEMSSSHQICI